jgi:energy-dependent translational throttle protein EttA
MDGLGETAALVERFNELTAKLAEPLDDDEMQRVYDEMAEVQDAIDAADAWDLDRTIEIAMDALRVPTPTTSPCCPAARSAASRCAGCCCPSPTSCCSTSRPTTSTPRRSRGCSATCRTTGMVVAITHDRYFLDEVAEWILELDRGKGYPFEGNYSGWLEQKRERLAQEEREESARQRQLAEEAEWVKASPQGRRTKAKARVQAYETLLNQGAPEAGHQAGHHDPRRARGSATSSSTPRVSSRASATSCSTRTSPSRCRPAASSASSARTAPARPRCSG